MKPFTSTETRRNLVRTSNRRPSPRLQLCIDFVSTRSQLIGLFHKCNALQDEIYEVAQLAYKRQVAELRSLIAAKKSEISKQKNPEVKKKCAEVILLLLAKERAVELAKWELLGKLTEEETGRSRMRSHTI